MIKSTSSDFAAYVKIDISKQLSPIEDSIDDMLTRLEEFESMVLRVQQERGNVLGLTGTLPEVIDGKKELDNLCSKVDVIEALVINVRETLDSLEDQIQSAEEQFGYVEQNPLRSFFIPKIFKKVTEPKSSSRREPSTSFKTDDYFLPMDPETK